MDAKLWNLGAKVAYVDAEVAFLVALGGKLLIREKAATPAGARTLAKLTACAQGHEQNLDRIIGARDRARFVQVLRRISGALS